MHNLQKKKEAFCSINIILNKNERKSFHKKRKINLEHHMTIYIYLILMLYS